MGGRTRWQTPQGEPGIPWTLKATAEKWPRALMDGAGESTHEH